MIKNFFISIYNKDFYFKSFIILFSTILIAELSIYLSFAIRYDTLLITFNDKVIEIFAIIFLVELFYFFISKRFIELHRYFNLKTVFSILKDSLVFLFLFSALLQLFYLNVIPRSLSILYFFISVILKINFRLIISYFYNTLKNKNDKNQIIFTSFVDEHEFNLSAHIDDYKQTFIITNNKKFFNRKILNIKINSYQSFLKNKKKNFDRILYLPKKKEKEYFYLFDFCIKNNIRIQSFSKTKIRLINKERIQNEFEHFLESKFNPNRKKNFDKFLVKNLTKKNILVCGAGGSIGSQLVIDLLQKNCNYILAADIDEYRLFRLKNLIQKKLKQKKIEKKIKFLLINLTDKNLIKEKLEKFKFDIIYHCAAYKHVDLVQSNKNYSSYNNIIALVNLVELFKNSKTKFVFISSDKSIKPENTMGALKKFAEYYLLTQFHKKLNYRIVRFGNVTNSSGSLLPEITNRVLNNQSIHVRGWKKTNRYLMSIKSASKLVICSTFLNSPSNIFILDMGKPILIYDLIISLIFFLGSNIKNKEYPDGDLKLIKSNLNKGEKVTEILTESKIYKTKIKEIFTEKKNYISAENKNLIDESILDLKERKFDTFKTKLLKISNF